jgi:hypothetical protein
MLRGGRSPDGASNGESFRGPSRTNQELLLAVAPLPDAPEFRVAGWPSWLVPGHLSLSRAMRSRSSESDPH